MLIGKDYEAVGRLTLAFNEIEYCVEVYAAQLLGAPEWSVSFLLAGEGNFHIKANRFDRILQAIAQEHPGVVDEIGELRVWVKKAKDLAQKRNDFVHALVVHDFTTNETRLRIKGSDVAFNVTEITFLAAEAITIGDKLHTHCGDLYLSLTEARESE